MLEQAGMCWLGMRTSALLCPLCFTVHSVGKNLSGMRQVGAVKCCFFSAAPRQKDATHCKIGPEDPHLWALLAGRDKEAKAGVFRSRALRTPGLGRLRGGICLEETCRRFAELPAHGHCLFCVCRASWLYRMQYLPLGKLRHIWVGKQLCC